MPVPVGTSYVNVRPDLTNFGRELRSGMSRQVKAAGDDASRTLKTSFADAAKGAAVSFGAAFATVKVSDFLRSSIDAASDLQESLSKSSVVFGQYAHDVDNWARTTATSFGISRQEATEAAATFGNMFDAMGLSQDVSANMSRSIVELASDLASFNNIDISDAVERLRSGLLGEQEAVERLGINMSETRLKQKALEMGMGDGKKILDATSKAQAAYAIIMEDTGNAQGDFARTSGNLANQQRIMTAQWQESKAELGQGLLPVMTDVAGVINNTLIPAFRTLFLSSGADATGWAATLRDTIGDTVGFILGGFAGLSRGLANLIGAVPGDFGEGAIQNLRDTADTADEARVKLHASTGQLLLWNDAADQGEGAASRFATATRGILPELAGLADGTKKVTAATKEGDKAARDAADAQRNLEGAKRDYDKLLREGAVNEEKVADARERLDEATRSLNRANRELAQAQDDYNDAMNAYLALPTDTNYDKLQDSTDALADANDNVADAATRQKNAQADLAREKAGDPDYQDKLADAKDRVADAEDKIADSSARIAVESQKAADAQKNLNDELAFTKDNVNEILGLVRSYDNPPGTPPPGTPTAVTGGAAAMPGGFMGGMPGVRYMPTPPAPTTTNNVTINATTSEADARLIAKEVMWNLN